MLVSIAVRGRLPTLYELIVQLRPLEPSSQIHLFLELPLPSLFLLVVQLLQS